MTKNNVNIRIKKIDKNVILASNISKKFNIPHEKRNTLTESIIGVITKGFVTYESFYALYKLNFSLKKGDSLGVIGPNGSGKSTLLKIIARIFEPDNGKIVVNGKVVPLLELGIGFVHELTAKENIFLYGSILGLSKSEINQKLKSIIEFAGIEKFLDTPIKDFSTGMTSRLAFSIAKEVEGDIYLIDEVLSVGDAEFQKKCINIFKDFKKNGKTLVFVSHNTSLVKSICNKAIFLNKGKIIAHGDSNKVILKYEEFIKQQFEIIKESHNYQDQEVELQEKSHDPIIEFQKRISYGNLTSEDNSTNKKTNHSKSNIYNLNNNYNSFEDYERLKSEIKFEKTNNKILKNRIFELEKNKIQNKEKSNEINNLKHDLEQRNKDFQQLQSDLNFEKETNRILVDKNKNLEKELSIAKGSKKYQIYKQLFSNRYRIGTGEAIIEKVEVFAHNKLNKSFQNKNEFLVNESLTIRIHYLAKKLIKNPEIGIAITDTDMVFVAGPNSKQTNQSQNLPKGQGFIDYIIEKPALLAGKYTIHAGILRSELRGIEKGYNFLTYACEFEIKSQNSKEEYGLISLNGNFKYENNSKSKELQQKIINKNKNRISIIHKVNVKK